MITYLRLGRSCVIVAVGRGTERRTRAVLTCADTTSLCQVLLALCFPDLDLLFLAATTELFGLERVLRLELRAPVLGDVSLSHVCGFWLMVDGRVSLLFGERFVWWGG